MFAIGDFARLGRVSVRMLRHYDQLGLLTPQHVDAATHYRYYTAAQLPRLNRIVVLKDLGFTLRQIHQILHEEVSAAELRGMLRLRRAELAAAIAADETRMTAVEARLRVIDTEDTIVAPDVVVKRIPPARVAALWGPAASYAPDDVAPVIGPLFERLCQQLDEAAITPVGPAVAFYEHVDDGVRVHASLPVGGRATPPDPVELIDLPGITAATTIHCGSMSDSDAAIQDLARWVETHGYRSQGWAREVNLDTPSDESQWVTELQEPLVEPAE